MGVADLEDAVLGDAGVDDPGVSAAGHAIRGCGSEGSAIMGRVGTGGGGFDGVTGMEQLAFGQGDTDQTAGCGTGSHAHVCCIDTNAFGPRRCWMHPVRWLNRTCPPSKHHSCQ